MAGDPIYRWESPIQRQAKELAKAKVEMLDYILFALGGTLHQGGPVADLVELYQPTPLDPGVLSRSVFLGSNRRELGEVVVRSSDPLRGFALEWKVEGRVFRDCAPSRSEVTE